ncbi:MAG: hypothetical protein H0T42_06395 [Deltaproteobacteria bacterium]|nr:hypothetical protein [Deltaproteobacteria bacterium]
MATQARQAMQIVAACVLSACMVVKRPSEERSPSLAPTPSLGSATLAVTSPPVSAPELEGPTCGDGTCNGDESCSTCPNECGACSAGSLGSGGAPGTQTSWPCSHCITTVPAAYDPSVPAPLVVSLHGDEGSPRASHGIWKQAALDNGYILLSPECPRDLGCTGRWGTGGWHRDGPAGSVAWINAQIDAVEAKYNIDRSRIYLLGGSRGAVYVGFHADAFAPRIAGAAMYAGGYSSVTSTCASCALPVYILVGDRDYLLDIANKARDWFQSCGSEVVFDKMSGVRHRGIGKSLLKGKATTILEWFSARPSSCVPPGGS